MLEGLGALIALDQHIQVIQALFKLARLLGQGAHFARDLLHLSIQFAQVGDRFVLLAGRHLDWLREQWGHRNSGCHFRAFWRLRDLRWPSWWYDALWSR